MSTYDRIKKLCDDRGIAVTALEKEIGFGRGSIGKMKNVGTRTRIDRIQKIADYFGVPVGYLMEEDERQTDEPYYLNEETRRMAQFLFEHPGHRVLFDASRNLTPEDLDAVIAIINRMKD